MKHESKRPSGRLLQTNPGLDAFDYEPVRQHLERELVQSPVHDSQSQYWSKSRLFPVAAVASTSRRGRMCWIASVCCCTAENCWVKPSMVSPNSPAWEMRASRKRAMSTSFFSTRLSQRWHSCTTMMDIAFPKDRAVTFIARRAKSVAACSSCINPGSVLPSCIGLNALAWWTCRIAMECYPGKGCLARSTISFGHESGRQLTGFGREMRTIPPSGGVS